MLLKIYNNQNLTLVFKMIIIYKKWTKIPHKLIGNKQKTFFAHIILLFNK